MAYKILSNALGFPRITDTDTTAKVALGTIVQATDPTYNVGEFIYLKGLDATVAGSWVNYNLDDASTALLVTAATGPVGIAMSANLTGFYGWYQISGKAVGLALTGYLDNALVWTTATAGSVDDTVVDGSMVHLAKGASAVGTPSAGLAEFEISRPYTDGIAGND